MRYAQSVTNKFIPVMKNDKLNLWRAVYIERCKYGSGGSMVLPKLMADCAYLMIIAIRHILISELSQSNLFVISVM